MNIDVNNREGQQVYIVQNVLNHVAMGKFSLHLIDSAPGTGKTYTINMLNAALEKQNKCLGVMVYNNSLKNDYLKLDILATTCCKFIMSALKLKFELAKLVFIDQNNLNECFYKAYEMAFMASRLSSKLFGTNDVTDLSVVVLDEYTTVSPYLIVFLYFYCKKYNVTLVLCGDKNQQASIEKSRFIPCNNYGLAHVLQDSEYELKIQYRNKDSNYNNFLHEFKTEFINSIYNTNINYIEKYYIFEHLHDKFFNKQNPENIYLTSYHRDIYQQVKKLNHTKSYVQMLEVGATEYQNLDVPFTTFKQLSYLPLMVNCVYQYGNGKNEFGRLINFTQHWIELEIENGVKIQLTRKPLQQTLHTQLLDFCKKTCDYGTSKCTTQLLQYDARLAFITYHAVQGLTIQPQYQLDLNIDGMSVNAIYVGLSRVISPNQINAIITKDLPHLYLTFLKNNKYLYKMSKKCLVKYGKLLFSHKQGVFKHLPEFVETDNYTQFVKSNCNVKCVKNFDNIQIKKVLPKWVANLKEIDCEDLYNLEAFCLKLHDVN